MAIIRLCLACLFLVVPGIAQTGRGARPASAPESLRVIRYNGTANVDSGAVRVTFSFYASQDSHVPLWQEVQNVVVESGRFVALIGANAANGIPQAIFADDNPLWLGVAIDGSAETARQRLVAVPYALKAFDAERIAGLDVSQLVTRDEFVASLAAFPRSSKTSAASRPEPADTRPGRTPRPEGLLIGSGTPRITIDPDGFIHALREVTAGVTIQAEALATDASTATAISGSSQAQQGIGVRGDALSTSGVNTGVLGTTASTDGYAGLFNNQAAGKIAGFQSAGTEVAFVDAAGFHGSGANLQDLPAAALTGITSAATGGTGLSSPGIAGNYLRSNGTGWISAPIQPADIVGASGFVDTTSAQTITGVKSFRNNDLKIISFGTLDNDVVYIDSEGIHGSGLGVINVPGSALTGVIDGSHVGFLHIPGTQIEGSIDAALLSNTFSPSLIGPGTADIDISGTAAAASNAMNLGGVPAGQYALGADTIAEANTRVAADLSLQSDIDALATSVTTLSTNAARIDQTNVFAANNRQIFSAGNTNAGFNLAGVTVDPSAPQDGDVWFRSDSGTLSVRVGGVKKDIAFTDSPIGNAATANTLAANGTNCSAGFYALGVDAAGNAEGCTSAGTVTNITAGAGLSGGSISTSGIVAIAGGGVTNAMLANDTINIVAGNAMFGGGSVALGGSVTLHNAGVTSLSGTPNQIESNTSIGSITLSLSPNLVLPGKTTFVISNSLFAPINLPPGGTPSAPLNGDFWNDSGLLRLRNGTTTNSVVISPGSTAFTFVINPIGLTIAPGNCAVDLRSNGTGATFTIPGAAIGDPVVLAVAPDSADSDLPPGLMLFAWVHAQNNVTLRMCNGSSSAINIGNNPTFKISGRVLKF